jgi:SAM-dependent methyltransferase
VTGHAPGAASIPLAELAGRVHELPDRDEPFAVYDDDPTRLARALALLRERGFERASACVLAPGRAVQTGPSRVRLWRPNPFLAEVLPALLPRLPGKPGRALDVAMGTGRDAVFLALHGLEVSGLDLLPDAVERATDLARRNGVSIRARVLDLETDPPPADAIPPGAYDLVVVFRYLHRPLLPAIRAGVRPGGFVVYETFTTRQRELFGKPRRDAFLLDPGELGASFAAAGFEVEVAREGLAGPRRHVASVVARRPGPG